MVVFRVVPAAVTCSLAGATQSALRLAGRWPRSSETFVKPSHDLARLQLTNRPSRSVTAPKAFTTTKAENLVGPIWRFATPLPDWAWTPYTHPRLNSRPAHVSLL